MTVKTKAAVKRSTKPATKPTETDPQSDYRPASDNTPVWALAWDKERGVATLHSINEIKRAWADASTMLWIDLTQPTEEVVHEMAAMFNIHPLVVEDILERNQRAKVEVSDDTLHLVMFALEHSDMLTAHEFEIVLGHRFLLTVHDDTGPSPREAPFRRRDTSTYLAGGPDFVLWAITDWLVDGYFPVFDQVGDEIDALEEEIIDKPGRWVVERLSTSAATSSRSGTRSLLSARSSTS